MSFEEYVRKRIKQIEQVLAVRDDPQLVEDLAELRKALQWCRGAGIYFRRALNLPSEEVICCRCVFASEGDGVYLCNCPNLPFSSGSYTLCPGDTCSFYQPRRSGRA